MFPKSRLVAVAAAAGAVCALATAGSAMAATPNWSPHNPAVPNAYTNTTPALSQIQVNGQLGTFLAWKGQYDNKVQYKYRLNGKWHGTAAIPGATTDTSPTAALFATTLGSQAVFVAWKSGGASNLSAIKYSDGIVGAGGKINWTKPVTLPGGFYSKTSASPAVLFPANAKNPRVILAYRGPYDHVRVEIGTEIGAAGRRFSWGTKTVKSAIVDNVSGGLTSGQPALAEILGVGGNGYIYVAWTSKLSHGVGTVNYSSTTDTVASGLDGDASLTWSAFATVTDATGLHGLAETTGSPAVSSANIHGAGPLLLAYKGPSGFNIRYQTFNGASWTSHQFVTGNNNTTALGPALVHGTLASVSRTDGKIFLHQYRG
jgi:hypothetical protein